jgi:hypothetical protein
MYQRETTINGWEETLNRALYEAKHAFETAVAENELARLGSITVRMLMRPDPNRYHQSGLVEAVLRAPEWGYGWTVSVVEES